jgi:LuxR family transcriptional regulator, maltose regulon positive regulatory protein
VERALVALDDATRDSLEMRVVQAALRLAQNQPEAATAALAPLLDDPSAPVSDDPTARAIDVRYGAEGLLLAAIALDALRDAGGASRALERALDLAEPEAQLLPFLLFPASELLERHARLGSTHAPLISEILGLLAGRTRPRQPGQAEQLAEPLSRTELRVLRYLPTSLPVPEIASELFVSANTIRTHTRHMYAKLGVHTRATAVERARELGLLAPTSRSQ